MSRKLTLIAALALLPIAACSNGTPPATTAAAPTPPPVAANDQTFANTAATGGMAEVQAAQLALTKTKRPGITRFANDMITDHTKANQQLMQLAQSKNITLPTSLMDDQQQQLTKLQGESGRAFNHDYVADQAMDHQMMLTAFQDEAANGTDPDLKAFAAQTVPVIQSHLVAAQKLASAGGGGMRHHMRKHMKATG